MKIMKSMREEKNLDSRMQKEMYYLVKHLASCEQYEVEGLKARAARLMGEIRRLSVI